LQAAAFDPHRLDCAEAALKSAVEQTCLKLNSSAKAGECLQAIKATMSHSVGRRGLNVIQMLYELERVKSQPHVVPELFENEICDFLIRNYQTPKRKARQIASNAWKENPGADRRVHTLTKRILANKTKILSAHRGRPDLYDPHIVWAFADSIAAAAGRKKFSLGHHGDKAIINEQMAGPMLRVLVAAVRWATTIAWIGASERGLAPPLVKTEGILTLIKRGRPRPIKNSLEFIFKSL